MKVITLSEEDRQRIIAAASIIEKNLKYHYRIRELASKVLIGESKLKDLFKIVYGVGPYAYRLRKRLEQAQRMLLEDDSNRTIALAIGFTGDQAETNFIKFFKKEMRQSPSAWKKEQFNKLKTG